MSLWGREFNAVNPVLKVNLLDQINLFCLALTGFFPVAVIGCYMQATAD